MSELAGTGIVPPRVLVVEDHEELRARTIGLVEQAGLPVIGQATTCASALAAAEQLRPDVVLLDLSLPDGSGLDVLKKVRPLLPAAKVIILTAYEDDELERVCLAAGATAFVGKSRLRPQLLEVLQNLASVPPPAP